jgi:hypothetical protein
MPTFCDRICDTDLEAVEAIRSACHSLLPSWQNPEAFFLKRSNITSGLTKLIRLIASEPRVLGRAVPGLRVVGGGTVAVPALRGSYAAPRAQALSLASRVFAAPVAPLEPRSGGYARARSRPLPRRHHYPLPPVNLNTQGRLL